MMNCEETRRKASLTFGFQALHTISPDAAQAEHQAQAVRRHQEQEAERISRLPEIVKESEPNQQNPLNVRPRLKPLPTKRASLGSSSRVKIQRAAKGEKS